MDIYYIANNPPKEDGALKFDEGEIWFENGHIHRADGPAIIWNDGRKDWFIHGERHRIDGPAVEVPNGMNEWLLNGNKFTRDSFPINNIKILNLH